MSLRRVVFLVAAAGVILLISPARAAQPEMETMMKSHGAETSGASVPALNTLDDLKAEVARLRDRVAMLEALKPTMTSMMPDFAERFHVMHRASDEADWAVAAHELAEMKRLVKIAPLIDAKAGPLMQAFMAGPLGTLGEIIEHGDKRGFDKALAETIASCNGCHAASGSTITVTLDVHDELSMRHPHALKKSKVPKSHMH